MQNENNAVTLYTHAMDVYCNSFLCVSHVYLFYGRKPIALE